MPTPPQDSNTDGDDELSAEAVALMLLDGLEASAGHADILMLIVREIPGGVLILRCSVDPDLIRQSDPPPKSQHNQKQA